MLSASKATAGRWETLFAAERADVAFACADGVSVKCNRSALSAASRYFDCMLNSTWREAAQDVISLPEVDSHVLNDYIFEHFRTGAIPAAAQHDSLSVVMEAYELARLYGVRRLELLLLTAVVRKMDIATCRWLLRRAMDLSAQELVAASVEFLSRVWSRGATGVAIEGISHNAVMQYLQSPVLLEGPVPEEHVLQAIVEWGKDQLGLDDRVWMGETSPEEQHQLAELLQPLLGLVKLEEIPAAVLEAKVEPLKLFSPQQILQVYKHQAKLATPVPGEMHVRSFWDSMSMPGGVALLDATTVTFTGLKGHKAAAAKLGLTRGKWRWRLRAERIGRKYAWAGVMDATVDLAVFPGSQPGGFLFGSGGFLRSKHPSAPELDRYGISWHRDGTEIDVHLDMDARTCGFSVNGAFLGTAYTGLPACVFPAASMSGGGVLRFLGIDADGCSTKL